MSRNLCQRHCEHCGDTPLLCEPARPITRKDCGAYFDEYEGMTVAAAECPSCLAQYLAWVNPPKSWSMHGYYIDKYGPESHFDLSYRSTFNDEPGPDDLPRFRVELQRVRVGPFSTDQEEL